jgi:glycosyltransferase involved in cell wall biosynthesis
VDVSIIVPCFNGERFVEQAVTSALAQEGALEVIVVDDGSTDRSASIVQSMADRDERVELCRGPNRGVANARNTGAGAISPRSRYILFLDADDVLAPGAIRVLQQRLEREPDLGAAFGSRARIDPTGALIDPAPVPIPAYFADRRAVRSVEAGDRIGYWHILPINPISTPGQCLIRRSALPAGDVFDQRYAPCEDWELWLRLARRSPFGVEHREVLSYRDHPSSASKGYQVMYEQRGTVFRAQLDVVAPAERRRLQTAWRFGMFGFDARVCLQWARERFAARDLPGAARYLVRSLRDETRYLWAAARGEPNVDIVPVDAR